MYFVCSMRCITHYVHLTHQIFNPFSTTSDMSHRQYADSVGPDQPEQPCSLKATLPADKSMTSISFYKLALISYCLDAQSYLELHCPHMAFYLAVKGLNTNITSISHDNTIVTNSISCQYSLSYCKNTNIILCAYNDIKRCIVV